MRRRAALVLNSISLRAYLKQLPVPWQHLPCSCPWACLIATVGPWDVILCLPIFEPMPYQTHRNREALAAKSRLRLTMSYTLRSADQSHRSTNPSNHGNFPSYRYCGAIRRDRPCRSRGSNRRFSGAGPQATISKLMISWLCVQRVTFAGKYLA
ncbi:hypothetical protein FA13DRAFT_757640 [Coprinellus micaceus]|uniref:Uncharacterized protein n=1 Tax=Coprinellus micaceus TaxID=71717 RepID=A0A4Y7T3M6_COPMI|nr:hypothetical protein FA13DRAFT_757640 [Coprinellus micaceus]